MGPLNEYQRRFLDVVQSDLYLKAANQDGPPPEYFGYVVTIGSTTNPLTNGVTQQAIIAMQADSWFLWQYFSVGVIIPLTGILGDPTQITDAGNLLIQVTDTGAGEDLYNIPSGFSGAPGVIQAGSPSTSAAGIPYSFPTPRLLPPNTNINISATKYGTNVGGDNPDYIGVYFMLNGARISVAS
jgi:hypothetical protein